MTEKIIVQDTSYSVDVYLNDTLHLCLAKHSFVGVQSWIDAEKDPWMYIIEFTPATGREVTCGYEDRALWEEILGSLGSYFGLLLIA